MTNGKVLDECDMDWDYLCDPERIPEGWVCNRGAEWCPAAVPKLLPLLGEMEETAEVKE